MAVDVASGTVSLTYKDIFIPGKFPLEWRRRFSTSLLIPGESPLGPGWVTPYFSNLTRRGKDWHFQTGDGGLVIFSDSKDEVESGNAIRDFGTYHEIAKSGFYIKVTKWDAETHDVTSFFFQPARNGQPWPLRSVENGTGQGLDLAWDDRGLLKGIRQKLEKRTLVVQHTPEGKLFSVSFLHPDGRQQVLVKYQYDGKGMLVSATNALDQSDRYDYRSDGRLVREVTKDGAVFNFKYDDMGRCIRTWGIDNFDLKIIRYFDNSGWSEVVDSYGGIKRYHRVPTGQIDSEMNPLGGLSRTEYDEFGRITKKTDPLEAVTEFIYDEDGNRTTTIDPMGNKSTFLFNSKHQPIGYIDPIGSEWGKILDDKGRLKAVKDPGGGTWEYDYDEHGNPIEIRNPMGPKTRLGFLQNGDLAEIKDWDGLVSRYKCDSFGRIVRFESPTGKITSRSFDLLGRMVALEEGPNEKYSFQYNAKGKLIQSTDGKGRISKRVYGTCGRLYERIDPLGKRVKYVWGTEPGRLLKLINEHGDTYEFTYDAGGNKVKEKAFDGKQTIFKRNVAGNCIETGDGGENSIILASDKNGRLISKTFPDNSAAVFTYDPIGRVSTAENADCKLEFKRDPMGRVVEEKQGDHVLLYEYDISGNLLRIKTDEVFEVAYGYGDSGKLARIVHNGKNKIEFKGGGPTDPASRSMPGGVTLSHQYHAKANTLFQSLTLSDNSALNREFRFNDEGLLASVLDSRNGETEYFYNQNRRVTKARFETGEQDRYEYDDSGHLLRMELAGRGQQTFEYAKIDRLKKGGERYYTYDTAGRLESISDSDASGSTPKWTFEWDPLDQLRKVVKPDGNSWSYSYDPLGRRIAKRGPQCETKFVWDRHVMIRSAGNESANSTWIYPPSGFVPVGKNIGGRFFSIIPDHLGTPVEMVDEEGEIAWSASYTLFGEIKREDGKGPSCEVRFPGQWFDEETGFHYNRFRYYDPSTGNYISQDPIGLSGGINPYAYGGDPLNWIDPFGLVTLYRGMKKDANGQPVIYSGEPTGNGANNASNSLGAAGKDEGKMSTNKDPANVIPPRKPPEFDGKQKDAAMFAIDSDVLAEHGLVAVPFDGPDDPHIGIQVADGIPPESLPERLAATKEHWKPVTPEDVKKQQEAEAKKEGGCSG